MSDKNDLEYIEPNDVSNAGTQAAGSNKNNKNIRDNKNNGKQRSKQNRKKLPLPVRIIIGILVALIAICLILTCVFFGMRSSGKNKLYQGADSSAPDMGNMFEEDETQKNDAIDEPTSTADETTTGSDESSTEETTHSSTEQNTTTAQETTTADASGYVYQAGDVNYNGHVYRYNKDILTFLVLGIDQDSTVPIESENIDYWQGGQSDAIFLFVMNPHNKDISVVAINRNSMTDVDLYDRAGNYIKTAQAQVCVQHGYGDGRRQSCERTKQTISRMMYNLPIHGYVSIRLGAVATLNDAVGGVDVTLPSDFPTLGWTAGSTVHLSGNQAYQLVRYRDQSQFDSATNRLGNEKAFLSGFINKVYEKTKSDVTFPVTLYQNISNYVVTDVSIDEMSYLASELLGYSIGDMKVYSVPGQTVMGTKFEEYYIDQAALKNQMLEIFYELVK